MKEPIIWVVGEALMDLIPVNGERVPMVGGGPANTAKAVARLGYTTQFVGGISSDEFGSAIEEELVRSGVDLSLALRGNLPTALAIATIDSHGLAKYDFELDGTTSFAFHSSWLPSGEPDVIHIGSVATMLEPGSSELLKWAEEKCVPIVFDPNVRPSIQGDKGLYRAAIERWIGVSTLVKLSEDDLTWLYGDESIVSSWLNSGPELVIVTRAEKGLTAYVAGFTVDVPAFTVDVVDTVGAGDTIGAVVVEGVLIHGANALRGEVLRSVLVRAAKAASITCSRAGANPPTRDELEKA
jgi:fructokinase